jgi:thiamine kinase-like enzyme
VSAPRQGDRLSLPADVVARLDDVPLFAAADWRAEELPGGLTNHNFRVLLPSAGAGADARTVVARLSNPMTDLLAIDREAEHACAAAAARSGAAPAVVDYRPGVGVLVVDWVAGRTYEPSDLRDSKRLPRVIETIRRLHAGERFGVDFDMGALIRRYLDSVQGNGYRLPDRFLDFGDALSRVEQALRCRAEPTVPCHNDLLAANFVDDGDRIWLVDYEYAGNNDPSFELGNLWSESNLADDQLVELVELYYGKPLRHKVARSRLQATVSQCGWMLWAAIQDAVSGLDFDFWSWGLEKYERAVEAFEGPRFETWLADSACED